MVYLQKMAHTLTNDRQTFLVVLVSHIETAKAPSEVSRY